MTEQRGPPGIPRTATPPEVSARKEWGPEYLWTSLTPRARDLEYPVDVLVVRDAVYVRSDHACGDVP